MLTIFVGLFLLRLLPAFALIHLTDASIQGVWCALVLDYAAKAALLTWRFRQGRWKTLEV